MGTMLIQYAKLSNFEVATTCSPHNFELVRSYGADHVYDYKDASSIADINAVVQSGLQHCVDCISTPESAEFCAAVLAHGGIYSSIGLAESPRQDVRTEQTLGWSFLGEEYSFLGQTVPASEEDFEYSRAFAELSQTLLAEGKIRPHPLDLRPGGSGGCSASCEGSQGEES